MKPLAVGILLCAALVTGCNDECESHDECDDDEYCAAESEEDEGNCVPRKERGDECSETRECETGLVCNVDEFDAAFGPTCTSPQLIDWGSACAVSAGAKPRSHLALTFALTLAGATLARRRRTRGR